jgi:hypothetical protein
LTEQRELSDIGKSYGRFAQLPVAGCLVLIVAMAGRGSFAADLTFNIVGPSLSATPASDSRIEDPFPPIAPSNFSYADVWAENGYAYVGSDRSGRGTAIFSISNSGIPTYLTQYDGIAGDGSEYEDVEVHDGIGYFSADVSPTTSGTGVDIVDLSIPFDPVHLGRVNGFDCLAGSPGVCAHNKAHTLSIQRFNPGTPSEQRFLYTSDNASSVIKITDVSTCMGDPLVSCTPQFVKSLPLTGVGPGVDVHEVAVRNNRLYAAAKNPDNPSGEGYFQIFDVSNPAAPTPLIANAFLSGIATHTAMPTDDMKTLIVAEERQNGNVKIYDISNVSAPILKATLNTSNVCHLGTCITSFSPHHVHVHGNLAFLPWYDAGLIVMNISNPGSPVMVGAFDTWAGASTTFNGNWGVDLSLGLKRVLLSDRKRGLIVVDASGVVIPGDYNQDMVVNADDYAVWRAAFGSTRSSVHDAPYADGNYDGIVDMADYVVWRDHFGQVQTGAGSGLGGSIVPEPATAFLFAIGVGLMMTRRARNAALWRVSKGSAFSQDAGSEVQFFRTDSRE